jgi:hypothetical protein
MVNVGLVLVFGAFFLRFMKHPGRTPPRAPAGPGPDATPGGA